MIWYFKKFFRNSFICYKKLKMSKILKYEAFMHNMLAHNFYQFKILIGTLTLDHFMKKTTKNFTKKKILKFFK